MTEQTEMLERLLRSRNARGICPDTVHRIWAEYTPKYKKAKDVDKAVREALHGICGAFMTPGEAHQLGFDMHEWFCKPDDHALERMLSRHASTRERLPLPQTDALYANIFLATGRPGSILDLACGINPLYLGARGIHVTGVDISCAAVEAVNRFGEIYHMPVSAVCADLLCPGAIPACRFDLALLFKLLPLLERQRPGAAMDVIKAVNAQAIVISFPTRTLGGRNVGMAAHYSDWMASHTPPDREIITSFEACNELFYVLK